MNEKEHCEKIISKVSLPCGELYDGSVERIMICKKILQEKGFKTEPVIHEALGEGIKYNKLEQGTLK